MKLKANCESHRQRGVALPIIMVILVLAALVTLYTATTSLKEQQVTADHYRSEQAFATAQAGVYAGVERHNKFESITNPENDISSGFTKGSYIVKFCDIWDEDGAGKSSELLMQEFLTDMLLCTNPLSAEAEADGFSNDERVGVLSIGKPDDASGRRTISVVSAPGLKVGGGPPGPPLTARGASGLTGNITLINRYANITLWLGEYLDFESGAVSTYIRPPLGTSDWSREEMIYIPSSTAPNKDIMDESDSTKISAVPTSNASNGQNADALTEDANLANLDPDDMFERVFSSDRVTVREMAMLAGQYYTDINELEDDLKEETMTGLVWLQVSGDASLNYPIGTLDAPAFLVVEFSDPDTDVFTITANAPVYGMVFVFGNASFSGGPKIYGAMMITNQVVGAGGGTIAYDPASLESTPEGPAGLRGIEPGTWKDWGYVK